MNKSLLCLSIATIIGSGPLFAEGNFLGGTLRVTGEYLYLKPTVENNYFVQVSDETAVSNQVVGREVQDQFSYSSGFRAEIGYQLCNKGEVSLGYSHLTSSTSKTVEGEFLSTMLGDDRLGIDYAYYNGTATNYMDVRFKNWGAYYTLDLCSQACCDFSLVLGLEYADIKFNQTALYVDSTDEENATGRVAYTSKTRGLGPMGGFKMSCPLVSFGPDCCHVLQFKGSASGTLYVSRNIGHSTVDILDSNGVIDEQLVDLKRERSSDLMPALNARVGLGYDFSFKCIDASFEVGYQLASYYQAVVRTHFPQDNGASFFSMRKYSNFNLQGLYSSGTLKF